MVREGSAPNFCPPTEEGITITLVDEKGEQVELEFLGLVLKGESSFGFFFPVDDEHPATSSGEVVVLEVTEVDEDGQPCSFELVDDEVIAAEAYADFQEAAKDSVRLRLRAARQGHPMIFVADPDSVFTLREQQILYYIAGGLSNKEIAGRLTLSEQTVKAHLSHMTTKCGRANRAALVAYGFETGLLRRR